MSTEFSINVNGLDIKPNLLYQIVPKIDHDAPDGFRDFGTTKILAHGVSDSVSCIFNNQANVWDTGFYVNSPCYRSMPKDRVKIKVDELQKHIVEPVEALLGKEKLSHIANNNFWDNLMIELRNGKVFNTSDPTDLLHLYISVLHFNLAPKERENEHKFKKARYCVIDKEAVVNTKQKRESDKNKAIGLVYSLFNANKKRLFLIFEYLGVTGIDEKTTEVSFNSVFNQYLGDKQNGYQNIELLLKAIEKTSDEEGLKELAVYSDLKSLFRKGLITKKFSEFYLDDVSLGTNFRDATVAVLKDKELETKVFELIGD